MTAKKDYEKQLQELLGKLEAEADELKLKMGLAKLEARDDWAQLEQKMDGHRGRLKVMSEEVLDASGDVGTAFETVVEEIKAGLDRVRKVM